MSKRLPAGTRHRTKICTSLSGETCAELVSKAHEAFSGGTDLVEFRLDLLNSPAFEKIRADLSEFAARSVFAVRRPAEGGRFGGRESERLTLIGRLRELKPAYLDVELHTLERNHSLALEGLKGHVVVSWHDLRGTPDRPTLLSVVERAALHGGLVKIVTTAKSAEDNLTVLSLYDGLGPAPIAFCMGTGGVFSRVMAMERGTPMAYASLPGEPTASGQFPLASLLALRRRLQGG